MSVRVVTSVFVCAGSCADPFSSTTPSTVRVWAGVRAGGDASVWVVMRACGCVQMVRRIAHADRHFPPGGPELGEDADPRPWAELPPDRRGRWAMDRWGHTTISRSMSPKRSEWMGYGKQWCQLYMDRSKSQPRSRKPRSRKQRSRKARLDFIDTLHRMLRNWLRGDKWLPKQFRSAKKLHEAIVVQVCD